ncbi:MAG: hypothetical protein ACODAA_04710 [Gemmatimonadota bacterium]
MHDDLLTQLSRIADLRVISRTSVEEFRDSEENLRDIADRLGARYVVEGAVDRVGDRVRVHMQLIDANSDGHVWAEQYDRTMTLDNLFAIRDDLTRRIASSLRASLTPETEERLVLRPTEDAEAFELYTRARHLYDRGARPDLERAIELYEQATARDPEFAAAHAGLAAAHVRFANFGFGPDSERFPLARTAMERVIELNPSHARARSALGQLLGGLGYEDQALEERRDSLTPGRTWRVRSWRSATRARPSPSSIRPSCYRPTGGPVSRWPARWRRRRPRARPPPGRTLRASVPADARPPAWRGSLPARSRRGLPGRPSRCLPRRLPRRRAAHPALQLGSVPVALSGPSAR